MLRSDVSSGPALAGPDGPESPSAPPSPRAASTPQDPGASDLDPGGLLQLLTPDGVRRPEPLLDPWVADVDDDRLLGLYEDMVVTRRFDLEAVALQRQGQLGLWPPLLGQEAAQIGSARALRDDDFVFTSYRENGVAYCRGASPSDLVRVWRGTALSGWDPRAINMATPQVMIGAQTLHATGYALGCRLAGSDAAAVAYFGDGATSKGDVHEAMVFAASFGAPVVLFCQNNQWAISEPVGLQARRALADRAPGYGIPALRVDGNDVLAVTAATRIALDRARSGGGPTFIEAVTYRRGAHTTSDDPTRYVDPAERARWEERDPITRVERLLTASGALTEDRASAVKEKAERFAHDMREGCLALPDPSAASVFEHVLVEPTPALERQRSQYAAYLAMFDDAPGDEGEHEAAGGAR